MNNLAPSEAKIDRAIVGALRGQDLSGFEIWRRLSLAEQASGLLAEPDLYPTLYRLEADGLLQSDWHEGERTRRKYRLTAAGLKLAEENGRSTAGYRGDAGTPSSAERTGGTGATSPDPDSGSWFVPSRSDEAASEPAATEPLPAASPAPNAVVSQQERREPTDDPLRAPSGTGGWGRAAVARYTEELGDALDLPRQGRNRVVQEIADHLDDTSRAIRLNGLDAATATTDAIGHLGSARDLAARVERAQQTPERMHRGIRGGMRTMAAEMLLWLFLSGVVIVLASSAADALLALGSLAGLHLVVLRPGPWVTSQIGIMLSIGAFSAGRISVGHLARISRHRVTTVRGRWAIGGAVVLLAVALLLPGYQDAIAVATLLVMPFAFVAGTLRPREQDQRAYSVRGVLAAVLLVVVVTLLPGGRSFEYDPSATPGAPGAPGAVSGSLTWAQLPDGTYTYLVPEPTSGDVVTVQVWPASPNGASVAVDGSAAAPAISVKPAAPGSDTSTLPAGAQAVDFTKLPAHDIWWVAAVVTSSDGTRKALDVEIQTGLSPDPSTALGWLISHI